MKAPGEPRVCSIPAGAPFLPALAEALLTGRLVEGYSFDGNPLGLADATIYVPTRRAARALRGVFLDRLGGRSAILPTIRPLGEFDEEAALFETAQADELSLAPPIEALDRVLLLAPLVEAWKRRLPAHIAALFEEEVVVPASLTDAIWLSRDLAGLMDEIETAGADWSRLVDLAPAELANWWQVTLEFLEIVTNAWPKLLGERDRANRAAYRNAMILAEAARLARNPPAGPVVAAGSTGSIPATAKLLAVIARLPGGAVVLPGFDAGMDERSWKIIGGSEQPPATFGHPQAGLKKLIGVLGVDRTAVEDIANAAPELSARMEIVAQALLPAETTDSWATRVTEDTRATAALSGVTLVEAANEREEALAIAVALRLAIQDDASAALVTGDRNLARRVAAELSRFGVEADDSGGTPLANTPPGVLMRLMLEAALRPGDPVSILSLIKHPLLRLGFERRVVREAAETVELVALRGGTGRPDLVTLRTLFEERHEILTTETRKPFWLSRLDPARLADARSVLRALERAVAPLAALRGRAEVAITGIARVSVACLEALARDENGGLDALYRGDAGDKLAEFLRSLVGTTAALPLAAGEWPDVLAAIIAGETVKPSPAGDSRVAIWGVLEARLQAVHTLVLGGLNEGAWPRAAEPDRFMSRFMKAGLDLEPPERRIGQAAHDFVMAMGAPKVVLTRAARAGDAPAVASRWLHRLETFAGKDASAAMRARGGDLLRWTQELDRVQPVDFARRPEPRPPVKLRPTRFSVTEIETLRRDPYAVYARRILRLERIEPLLRDPGAAERGTLFHDIVHAFALAGVDPAAPDAVDRLLEIGRRFFDEAAFPADVDAVWWPRFARMAGEFIMWDRGRPPGVKRRLAEARARHTEIGATGTTLGGRADRIDIRAAGMADIVDFKTGSSPSKGQAHTLVAPQLALEGALLMRGAFEDIGPLTPSELAYVRMKPNGSVLEESILEFKKERKSAVELSDDAWRRLEQMMAHYRRADTGYLSRALPFREGDFSGDYDHLARVLEWTAGGDEDVFGGGAG
jgi:ATP-dependent helicase/nuclease subunit B